MAKNRLILRNAQDPSVKESVASRPKAKKRISVAVLMTRHVFLVTALSIPVLSYAGFFSFISNLFEADTQTSTSIQNSQTMALLQAVVNTDPVPLARGGGDISIVEGTALLPESGPNGSNADVSTGVSQSDRISVYVVREGDTLSQIAKMFGVTTNTVAWNNDIQRGVIRPGQTLIILPVSGVQYTIAKGDTVASIAKKYKGDEEEIRNYNHLSEGATLAVGTVIVIPGGEMAPIATSPVTSNLRGAGGPDYGGYYIRPIIGGRKTQELHGYNGVDLASYYGAVVLASASGEVIVARNFGYNGGYGSYVVINHSNGTQTLYAHLSNVTVSPGQYVSQGEVIGAIGSTGRSTGAHLHFEIRGARNTF